MRIAVVVLALASIAATPFFDARFEPPAGVISGWGQMGSAGDAGELAAYIKAVAPHAPAMVAFEIAPDSTILPTFLKNYREFSEAHGFFVAQVGLDFSGIERDVATGMRDPQLYVLADGLRDVGRPVLLRIGEGFNNPGAPYEPSAYIGAFRHVFEVSHRENLNFAAVWDASAGGLADSHFMKWYPGDDVVDWWGIDFLDVHDLSSAASASFVEDAARHRKPVVIAAAPHDGWSDVEALKWYVSFFDFIRAHPAIKAFSLAAKRLHRWPKVAAYVKQQLAEPRFIDASEAPRIFRPPRNRP